MAELDDVLDEVSDVTDQPTLVAVRIRQKDLAPQLARLANGS